MKGVEATERLLPAALVRPVNKRDMTTPPWVQEQLISPVKWEYEGSLKTLPRTLCLVVGVDD